MISTNETRIKEINAILAELKEQKNSEDYKNLMAEMIGIRLLDLEGEIHYHESNISIIKEIQTYLKEQLEALRASTVVDTVPIPNKEASEVLSTEA